MSTNKKIIMMTIVAVAAGSLLLTAAVFTTPSLFASAIIQNQNTMGSGIGIGGNSMMHKGLLINGGGMFNNNIPQIKGTINLKNSTGNLSIKNVSVSFLTAAQSAQNAIANGKIIGGHIGVTQGFLTYNFAISNPTNNTISKVIVDAGNGKVLYTSPGKSINSTQFAMNGMGGMRGGFGGHLGFHGMNNGFGHWWSMHNQRW